MNFTVKVKDLAGNEYTDSSLDNFFKGNLVEVDAIQTIEYCLLTNCAPIAGETTKTIEFDTGRCTSESLSYNETMGYCTIHKSDSTVTAADCFCTWYYTENDKGTHASFRLPAYETVAVPNIVKVCNETSSGAAASCAALGGTCTSVTSNPSECGSSTPWYCPCATGQATQKKVKSITTTFYPTGNSSISASATVTVRHLPPQPASIVLGLPNSKEAGTLFDANVTMLDKFG